MHFLELIRDSYTGYANYLWSEITHPTLHNYFYWLIGISLFFFALELAKPWSRHSRFRKDFWLDFFYMFFNFFLFSLIIYNAASNVAVHFFNDLLASIGITNLVAFEVMSWPVWAHLLIGFIVRDFVQWNVHRLLHRVPWLWEFHKVHHSVEEMGFAAHLRFHWMENVVYRTIEYIPLALIGIGLRDFFIIHIFTLAVGHFNHSNIKWNLGFLKYIFNNPQMHIWHHAYDLPKEHRYGVNFGLTLSLWDYLFGTDYIPREGKNIRLGFPGVEQFPKTFIGQNLHGFKKQQKRIINKKLLLFFLTCTILTGNILAQDRGDFVYPIIKGYGGVSKIETSILPKTVPKIIVDLTSTSSSKEQVNSGLDKVARLINLYGLAGLEVDHPEIAVIIHDEATLLTLDDTTYSKLFGVNNPNRELLSLLKQKSVKIMVCGQALVKRKFGVDHVDRNVEISLSAITVLADYQQNGFSVLYF